MFPQKWRWAPLIAAVLGSGLLLRAADSPDAQVAGSPIPQAADSHTTLDLKKQYLEWYKRTILTPLQAVAKGQAWETGALKFVEDSLPVWSGAEQEDVAQAWAELAARGDALIKGGCDEPTVLFIATRFKVKSNRNKGEISPLYRRALDQLEADSRYRRAFACVVAVNLSAMLTEPNTELEGRILKLRRAGSEEGSYSGADGALFVDQVLSEYDPLRNNWDATEKLVADLKDLPEWAQDTILGHFEIAKGWQARGHGYSNTVTEAMAKEYRLWLDKAGAHLEEAWKLQPNQPYAAADMIRVAMDSGPGSAKRTRLWFDRTVKARFDYMTAYTTYTFSLLPRWGGTYEQMLAFGRACAATKRYDTVTPRHFIRVLDDIGGDSDQRRDVYLIPGTAREVIEMDKGYIATPARPYDLNFCLSSMVFDAWLCHEWGAAKTALDQLPNRKLNPYTITRLGYFGAGINNVIGETLIYAGPARDDYAKARELEKEERYEEAAGHYAAALKASGDEPVPRHLIEFLSKNNDTRIELNKGNWVEIQPKAADHSDWLLSPTARWSVPEDGVLEVSGNGSNTMTRWHKPVGEDYELRATFEFLSPPAEGEHFAILLGEAPAHPNQAVVCDISSDKMPKGSVRVSREFIKVDNREYAVELEKKNEVQIQCWHGMISLYLNGKAVFERLRPAAGNPSDHYGEIGFGARQMPPRQTLRITNVTIRTLKTEPVHRTTAKANMPEPGLLGG
jgi:hypothetical protein